MFRKKKGFVCRYALLLGLIALGVGACGKDKKVEINSSEATSEPSWGQTSEEVSSESTEAPAWEMDLDEIPTPEVSEEDGTSEDGKSSKKETKQEKQEKILERQELQRYNDGNRSLRIIGLKSYKKLKSDRYEDPAEKGMRYLVLFLEIRNSGSEKLYFNPYQIRAMVDGEEIEHSVLWNEPEGYPTIFTNVEKDGVCAGYVCWKVPEDWKELRVGYHGFRLEDGEDWGAVLTKDDLYTPDAYKNTFYATSE